MLETFSLKGKKKAFFWIEVHFLNEICDKIFFSFYFNIMATILSFVQ